MLLRSPRSFWCSEVSSVTQKQNASDGNVVTVSAELIWGQRSTEQHETYEIHMKETHGTDSTYKLDLDLSISVGGIVCGFAEPK